MLTAKHKSEWGDLFALGICLFTFVGWAFFLTHKYTHFGYYDWDLAFFNQATWNLLHGRQLVSLFGLNFFGNHANLIAFLCLPIYMLFQHPLTLVFLKIASYTTGAFVFYRIGKTALNSPAAILLMLCYLIYPPNVFAMLYEFDYEALAPIFLFLLYYFFANKRFLGFVITALFTILIKENMPLIILAFGVYAVFDPSKREKIKWGVFPIVLGIGAFYLLSTVLPSLNGESQHAYLTYYKKFGNSPLQIIFSILVNPSLLIPYITSPANLKLLFDLFSPVIFLPLLRPDILFLISPILTQHLVSTAPTIHSIYFNYSITVAPFIFIATLKALTYLYQRCRAITFYIILMLLGVVTLYNFNYQKPAIKHRVLAASLSDHLMPSRWQLIKEIPKQASVIASFDFLAELSSRKDLYAFYKVYGTDFHSPSYSFRVPADVQYALIDFKDGWLAYYAEQDPVKTARLIQEFLVDFKGGVLNATEDIVLLKKNESNPLIETSMKPFNTAPQNTLCTIDQKFALISFMQGAQDNKNNRLPLTFVWKSQDNIRDIYSMSLILVDPNKIIAAKRTHEIGYKIYPTLTWEKGEHVKEFYSLVLPALPTGNYQLIVRFYNLTQQRWADIKTQPETEGEKNGYLLTSIHVK